MEFEFTSAWLITLVYSRRVVYVNINTGWTYLIQPRIYILMRPRALRVITIPSRFTSYFNTAFNILLRST